MEEGNVDISTCLFLALLFVTVWCTVISSISLVLDHGDYILAVSSHRVLIVSLIKNFSADRTLRTKLLGLTHILFLIILNFSNVSFIIQNQGKCLRMDCNLLHRERTEAEENEANGTLIAADHVDGEQIDEPSPVLIPGEWFVTF